MANDQLLICTVMIDGGRLVSACTASGWVSTPVETRRECGSLWDQHRTEQHVVA